MSGRNRIKKALQMKIESTIRDGKEFDEHVRYEECECGYICIIDTHTHTYIYIYIYIYNIFGLFANLLRMWK